MSWDPSPVGARATWTRTITAADVEAFALFSGDRNPLHFDPAFAAATRVGRLVVQGGLTTALFNVTDWLMRSTVSGPEWKIADSGADGLWRWHSAIDPCSRSSAQP